MLRHLLLIITLTAVTLFGTVACAQAVRPPAVPLVTHDPYFSIWSMSDELNAGPTRHWTGKVQRLTGLVRIDGNVFRWMGDAPRSVAALPQTGLTVTPTRTVYQFAGQGVSLQVDFLSPLLPSDPDVMSRPVTYITMTVRSKDATPHSVQLLFAADAASGGRQRDAGSHLVAFPAQSHDGFARVGLRAAGAAKIGRRPSN